MPESAVVVEAAIRRDPSTTKHYQACSKDAFAAGRLVAAPAARRSYEYHEEALEAAGCQTAARRPIPAEEQWQEELALLENVGQPELP